jgi:hypothetical protein
MSLPSTWPPHVELRDNFVKIKKLKFLLYSKTAPAIELTEIYVV